MPMYPYECPECGFVYKTFKPMSESGTPESCSECGALMDRVFTGCASLDTAYHKPIEMFSVAPTGADELTALRKKLPDTVFTDQGVPLAHNLAEKQRILAAAGFEDRSGRG